jgi:N-acetylneuraminic acid mutarotase
MKIFSISAGSRLQLLSVSLSSLCLLSETHAQNTWTNIADFLGTARRGAVAFSIGDKGYIGTGNDGITHHKDLWEFDSYESTWSQKADLPGLSRDDAVGISIGNFGYIGTGSGSGDNRDDFWQYDPVSNTWTQKADFGGGKRYAATGFSIGNKGYLGTGYNGGSILKKDFYEYDPATDTWTKKANVGGVGRWYAVSFVIGEKGYVGTARTSDPPYENDLWEYVPATDTWTQKTTMPGENRLAAVAFAIGGKGYVGTGLGAESEVALDDFYEYDPVADNWTQKADFAGSPRYLAVGFAIGNKGYIGTGQQSEDVYFNDFWEYTPDCNAPVNLTTTGITGTKATLKWDAVATAVKYNIRYKIKGNNPWMSVSTTDTSKKISGLIADTSYTWQVRSVCSTQPVVSSDWSEKKSFTTAMRLEDQAVNQSLVSVYPNPVTAASVISLFANEASPVTVELFDLTGRKVTTLAAQLFDQGLHKIPLNADRLTTGTYLLRVVGATCQATVKLVVE